ncbi:MAG: DinB family protein [Chloroflexota bacterium]
MDLLDRLLDHDRWATNYLLELSPGFTDEQLDEEFDIGLRSLRATFDHLIFNIDFWTRVMLGEDYDSIDRPKDSISTLIERHDRAYTKFATLARRLREENRWDETFVDHFGGNTTYGGGILHVVLHNEGHRTEAVHIITRLGVDEPPEVDHGLWDLTVRNG